MQAFCFANQIYSYKQKARPNFNEQAFKCYRWFLSTEKTISVLVTQLNYFFYLI